MNRYFTSWKSLDPRVGARPKFYYVDPPLDRFCYGYHPLPYIFVLVAVPTNLSPKIGSYGNIASPFRWLFYEYPHPYVVVGCYGFVTPVSGCWLLWITKHLPAIIPWNPRPSSDSSRTHVISPWWRHPGTYTWRRRRRRRRRPSRARSRTRKSAPRSASPGRYPGGRWSASPHNSELQHRTQRINSGGTRDVVVFLKFCKIWVSARFCGECARSFFML